MPRTDTRLLGLRGAQRGQGAIEYVGLVVVVAAIVGALVATGAGPVIAEGISTQVCRITGGSDCGGGGGGDTEAVGEQDGPGADDPAGDPATDTGGTGGTGGTDDIDPGEGDPGEGDPGEGDPGEGDPGDAGGKTPTQIDYEAALKELQDAQAAERTDSDKAKEAAKELAKILADELGITDALDCVTKGDMGACTETLVNVLLSLVGGAVGKLAAKYGAPWKWKKAVELVAKLKKHGGDLYDGIKGLIKNRKRVGEAEDRLADAKRRLDAENAGKKDKPGDGDKEKPDKEPVACPVRHSFLPGTPVLLADGRRMAIDRIPVGTRVLATDPVTGVTRARPVVRTITTHDDKDFTRLTVATASGPAVITATDTHPFWLSDRARWADAGEIVPGDELRTPAGAATRVVAVGHYTEPRTTHDLTVAGIHTYYVFVGSTAVLVHNDDCDMSPEEAESARKPTVGEGDARKFKDHFLRHKKLVEDALGTRYRRLKEDGPRFREDIAGAIEDGTFELVGKGTLKKGEPEGLIYRGRGVTIVLRENGDFWTALRSGEGLDTSIEITKKAPGKKG
ncbi:polymorphic toxin-type HINT domain-containing protein [Streptomyces sp. NPDC056909]|uniref:polymorphic toxin-type HINT domain-containing protein n=1 Tax=Streptomyces sp. NPDC056909 TaxID=3345963 RepID=UPI0036A0270F